MELKILATSDVHLGMRFAGYPEVQEALIAARFESLGRLIEVANREGCGLLIVAGDLFHGIKMLQREIRRTAEILAGFEGQAAAVLPGNHDFLAGSPDPLWSSLRRELEAVKADRVLVLERPECTDLLTYGLPVHLYAAPCHSKHGRENAVGWITDAVPSTPPGDTASTEVLRLGVAHGSIEGLSPDTQGEYFPMRRAELERAGLDLWIVGHTHRQHPERDTEEDWLLVPGTPEPDGFDCLHDGAAWLVEVSGEKKMRRRSLSTGRYRFRRETLVLEDRQDPSAALERFQTGDDEHTLLRLSLQGRLSRDRLQEVHRALPELGDRLFWIEVDESGLAETLTGTTIDAEFPRGSFSHRVLHRLLDAGDPEGLQTAYQLLQEARR